MRVDGEQLPLFVLLGTHHPHYHNPSHQHSTISLDFRFGWVTDNVVSMTYDQSSNRAYINNALVGTQSNSNHNLVTTPALLGLDSNNHFSGQIFSFVTSSAVLSASDRSLLEGCSQCPAGTYLPTGTGTSCISCPAGEVHPILICTRLCSSLCVQMEMLFPVPSF